MWILDVLLTSVVGVGLAWFGLRYYSIGLAGAVAASSIYSALATGPVLTILIVGVVFALLTYFLSTPLTYLWSFGFVQLFTFLVTAIAVGKEYAGTALLVSLGIALVTTILLRKQLKAILVGLFSGSLVGIGAATLVFFVFVTGSAASIVTFNPILIISMLTGALLAPFLTYLAVTIGGVVFQYQYILKHNPELLQSGGANADATSGPEPQTGSN